MPELRQRVVFDAKLSVNRSCTGPGTCSGPSAHINRFQPGSVAYSDGTCRQHSGSCIVLDSDEPLSLRTQQLLPV
jgi:hypothetical protein